MQFHVDRRSFAIFSFCALSVVFLTPKLFSQATSGTLLGTIVDSTGAGIPGANITIVDTGRGISRTLTSNESGNYTQTQLAPGNYNITVEKAGFKKSSQQNVTVNVAQATTVNVTLELGQTSQEVTVTEAPPALVTDRAEVQTTLTSRQISDLPLLNRNFTNLTLLVPGATINTFQHAPSENPQQSTLVNTNGQEFAGTNYLLDGMNNNDAVLGIVMVNPAVDSVGEAAISTSNYDAEYTAAGGAVVNINTKSGTNRLHGSAFEFLQNNIFQARDSFTQGLHAPGTPAPDNRGIPELRFNQFGGTIGGPIVKDKLFFFGDYQGTRRRIGASQSVRVPTAAERSGNLSDLGTPIHNPFTGNADGTGRSLFPGAIIPASLISTPVNNLLAKIPLPNIFPSDPAANNYATSTAEPFDTNQWDARGDYYTTEKLRFFGRYSYLGAQIVAPGPFGLYGGSQFPQLGFSGASDARNQNLASGMTYTFNPNLLTDVRFGFSRYRVKVSSLDANQQLANDIGIPGLNLPGQPDTNGLPQLHVNGQGGVNFGYSCNCPLLERETLLDFINNWTKIAGNHTIKFGGTVELAWNQRLPSDNHRSGVYEFNPSLTSSATDPSSGLGLASFLLGQPSQFNRFAQISTTQEDRQNRTFFFIQDTWRVTRNLTLAYGLRWDTWFPDFSLNSGQGGRYDVTTNIVYIPGVGGVSKSGNSQTQWTNLSPRFGIAYSLNEKTVLRTGYGRSYYPGTFGWTFNSLAADVYPSIVNQSLPAASPFQAVFPLTTAPPAVLFPTIPSNGRLPLVNGIGVSYIPADQKIPSVDQWNFTIERTLARDLNVSVGYVGNIGRHLNGGFGLNNAIPGPGPFDPRRPLYAPYGLTQGIFDKCNCTSSNYNALQIKGEKRLSGGLSLLASYTYSKTLDYGEFGTPTNQYNAQMDYGPAGFNRKNVFSLAHTYELPFGRGRKYMANANPVVNGVFGGWIWRGITYYASGLPFNATLANNASLNSDQSLRPNLNGDPFQGINQTRNLWFNPAVFSIPGPYLFGSEGRNNMNGPHQFQADWSLAKSFAIRERFALEFRWEVFNAFNNTNLALPVTNTDSSAAGLIQDIQTPMRNMQFGVHLTF